MKVLLMHPLRASPDLLTGDLGLGYLASALRQAGQEVRMLLRFTPWQEFRPFLRREKPDLVGIKVLTCHVESAARTVKMIRSVSRCPVVIGGPHVTGDPAGSLEQIPADFGFQGEADRSFPRFVRLLEMRSPEGQRNALPGLVYRKGSAIIANPPDEVENLDALPFPAWDLMPPADYTSLVRRQSPAACIIATRGCTNRCRFCAEAGRRLRFRSVNNVMAELRLLSERFGVREVHFMDSNFLSRKEYIQELCARIREERLPLSFCAANGTRLEVVDEEVCALLAEAGFYRVNVGIESGSSEVLRRLQKGLRLEHVRERIPLLRKHGIQVVGNFMLGFPGESREQMEQTLALALSLDLTFANFWIYAPMPGTRMYADLMRAGQLPVAPNFTACDFVSSENNFSALSPSQLRRFRNRCLIRFLARPRTLRTMWEVLRSGVSWRSVLERFYWMYAAPYFRRQKACP